MKKHATNRLLRNGRRASLQGLILLCLLLFAQMAAAQCNNTSPFGFATAPVNATVTVTFCNFGGEYHEIAGCVAGSTYISATDVPTDFLTVRRGTPGGPVVASGTTPLTWTATLAGSYFVHVNTNSFCGTDFNCHTATIQHACSTPAPSAVTASPTLICSGLTSNINATSAGNTIHWFTVPSGGTSVGTSASGANMPMSPTFTTTYYASAFNGSCFSARTPVTVTVTPAPNVMTIDASPDTVCIGMPSNLVATTCSQVLGFGGLFAPSNWVITHTPLTDAGIVHPAGAPASIAIESSNGGNFGLHSVYFTSTMQCSGTVSFNWSYVTTDVDGSAYDYPEYAINGVNQGTLPGFVSGGPNSQSGTFALAVTAGQQFSLIMTASDDILGSATTVYTNFSAPGGASGATINWFPVLTGGSSLGSSLAGINFPVSPGVTTTYYASATLGGCTSTPRVPIQVVAQNCVLPIEDVNLLGLTDGNAHSLFWTQLTGGPSISYDVERSSDGLSFAPIGLVDAGLVEGDRVQFSYLDNSPFPADNFYRLRYLGPDGDMRYTNTVRLRLADALSSFSLAPSPTSDATTYRFFSTRAYEVEIMLTDLLGRTVLQTRHQVEPGNNAISLDVSGLEHGTYMMQAHHLGTQARHSGMIVKVD